MSSIGSRLGRAPESAKRRAGKGPAFRAAAWERRAHALARPGAARPNYNPAHAEILEYLRRGSVSGRGGNDGQVRIIGGRWRNTRLPVPTLPGLRPSSDRVRETLFNWLMPKLGGARVLDLFAGSGALGLEAVSRGAAHATLVERDAQLGRNLTAAVQAADQVTVVQADALRWLQGAQAQQADLVFIDPPFADGLWQDVLAQLPRHLAADAWLYLESPAGHVPVLPSDWLLHRAAPARCALPCTAAPLLHFDLI